MLPYVLTIVVVAGAMGRAIAPGGRGEALPQVMMSETETRLALPPIAREEGARLGPRHVRHGVAGGHVL